MSNLPPCVAEDEEVENIIEGPEPESAATEGEYHP